MLHWSFWVPCPNNTDNTSLAFRDHGLVTPPPADKTIRLQPGLPTSGLAPPGLGKSLHPALCQHMPVEPGGIRPG
jgi:hypothetical protein